MACKKDSQYPCRILLIGASRARIAKVASLLADDGRASGHRGIAIEYLPCVASFDAYQDDTGQTVRYLHSIGYYENEQQTKSKSLMTIFDQGVPDGDDNTGRTYSRGVAGVVVGSGIDKIADLERIAAFLRTMSCTAPLQLVEPTAPYASMTEELAAYNKLSAKTKDEVKRQTRTMGPSKVAQTAFDLARSIIDGDIATQDHEDDDVAKPEQTNDDASQITASSLRRIDPLRPRYSCRTCRSVLFGAADLQDPPHQAARHSFSYRKQGTAATNANSCQSLFLQDVLPWMATTGSGAETTTEGKASCPYCLSKVGTWNWAGAQCSCGTWVVPAIQVPKSKVDEIVPVLAVNDATALPEGAVVSPLLLAKPR